MPLYVTMHLHNAEPGKDDALAKWFSGAHGTALKRQHGFVKAVRYEVAKEQVLKDIAQPWRYVTFYDFEFENPEIHVPALGALLAEARDIGLVLQNESECIWTYGMYGNWLYGPHWNGTHDFTHTMMLPANFIPGREPEYHDWYDRVHIWEVMDMPGYAGMRRGRLLDHDLQIQPRRFCPGSQLIAALMQTNDLGAVQDEFVARAYGKSTTGRNHGPRSTSASMARTVHFFKHLATHRHDS